MRGIETKDYAKIETPSSFGKPPRLEWLSISQLVVDPEYQREITTVGRKNVRRIAEHFNWSMFAPVVVAPVGSNKFAIVDGQHRTTAAALCKVDKVPCAIIEALRGEQAAAFRAINANITRMHTIQLHHASVAAGEAHALRIKKICDKAGVSVLRFPTAKSECKVGETLAVGTIGKALERFGDRATTCALKAIVATGGGQPRQSQRNDHLGRRRSPSRSQGLAGRSGAVARCARRSRSRLAQSSRKHTCGSDARCIGARSIREAADCSARKKNAGE